MGFSEVKWPKTVLVNTYTRLNISVLNRMPRDCTEPARLGSSEDGQSRYCVRHPILRNVYKNNNFHNNNTHTHKLENYKSITECLAKELRRRGRIRRALNRLPRRLFTATLRNLRTLYLAILGLWQATRCQNSSDSEVIHSRRTQSLMHGINKFHSCILRMRRSSSVTASSSPTSTDQRRSAPENSTSTLDWKKHFHTLRK
nr:hypothetical protein [Tolivirales sp.]